MALSVIAVAVATLVSGAVIVPSADAQTAPAFSQLTNIRTGRHTTYDRVVLDFRGPVPSSFRDQWVGQLLTDASDKPVSLRGNKFLSVAMHDASGFDLSGRPAYTGPRTFRTFALRNIEAVAITGDFEHVLSIGIGVRHASWVHVFTLTRPSRLVIDIGR